MRAWLGAALVALFAVLALRRWMPMAAQHGSSSLSPIWPVWERAGIEFSVAGVASVDWRDEPDFVTRLFASRRPALLRGAPALKWAASTRWDPEYVQAHSLLLKNVRVKSESSDSPTFLYYQDSRPMIALDELRARWKPEFHRVNLSAAEFFARCARAARGDTSSENAVYYSSTVSEWRGSGLEDEVGDPGHMFREALPAGARPSLHVWMGSAGVTSAAHYDAVHNFYVQIYGHKRFVLLPPASDRVLYTYPRLHPSARQSQIAFHRPDTAQFPLLFEPPSSEPPGHLQARDVVLAPGDVLYLPPYWFHYVTALDTSISLSLWLDAEELTWFRAASSHDVPLKSGASDAERRELAARYLALFLSAFAQGLERASGVPQAPPRDLVARMLNTRFIAFDTPPSPSSEPVLRGCGGPELVSEELLSRLDATAKAAVLDLLRVPESAEAVAAESVAARQLRDMRHEDNRAVAEIQAMDYVEEMLQAAVGADRVQPFLVALAERCLV